MYHTFSFNSEVDYYFHLEGVNGCCGLCTIYGFSVRNKKTGNTITEEEYGRLDHKDFIEHVEDNFLDMVEEDRYTRVIVTDVVPELIEDVTQAYYNSTARHNDAINLYTIMTDLKWETCGDSFVNKKTDNTVTVFYKDL